MTIELLAAIAQRPEQVALRHQRRDRDHRAGADEAERQRDAAAGRRQPASTSAPLMTAQSDEPGQRGQRLALHAGREARRCAARRCSRCRNRRSGAANSSITVQPVSICAISSAAPTSQIASHGSPRRELDDDEEDRQQIDEPQRAERLDEGFEIGSGRRRASPCSAANIGALKANWIVTHST